VAQGKPVSLSFIIYNNRKIHIFLPYHLKNKIMSNVNNPRLMQSRMPQGQEHTSQHIHVHSTQLVLNRVSVEGAPQQRQAGKPLSSVSQYQGTSQLNSKLTNSKLCTLIPSRVTISMKVL
jgi:hypothetical protein